MTRILLGLLACIGDLPAAAVDIPPLVAPTARFELEDGWVNVRLERDGKPIPNARLKVLIDRQVWAEGELGDTGRGTFPRPKGMYCQVVLDLGNGPAAPIPLNFIDDTLIPTDALVRDGTAACCKPPPQPAPPAPDPTPPSRGFDIPWWISAVALGTIAGALGWMVWRDRRTSTK